MSIHFHRLRLLLKTRSVPGWILLVLAWSWKRIGDWQNVEWLLRHLLPSGWGIKMAHPNYITVGLLLAALLWFTLIILWPKKTESAFRPKVFLEWGVPDRIFAGPLTHLFRLRNEGSMTAFRVKVTSDNTQEFWLLHDNEVNSIEPQGQVVFWCHAMRKKKGSADSYPLGGVPENRVETLLDAMVEAGMEPAISVTIEYDDFDRRSYKEVFRLSKNTSAGQIHFEHLAS